MDESTLYAALDAVDVGIALVERDGRIEYANAAFGEHVAPSTSRLVGASLFGDGCPCVGLMAVEGTWAEADGIAVTGENPQGIPVDVVARPVTPGARLRLVVVRRGFVRSIPRYRVSDDVVQDLESFLSELTGHPADLEAFLAPISILMLGIRDLDRMRDQYGEEVVEAVQREVAQALVLQKRKLDIISRYGDGQFLVLAAETPRHGAAMLADRIRQRVESIDFGVGDGPIPVTLATWVSEYRPQLDGSIREAVERGSEALVDPAIEPIG